MNVLLREVKIRDNVPEYQDTVLKTDKLSIGNSPRCSIHLCGKNVQRNHVEIVPDGRSFKLQCKGRATVNNQEKDVRSAIFNIGQTFYIESHKFVFINPPSGFNLAIEVWIDQKLHLNSLESSFTTDLTETWIASRPLAYGLVLLTVLLGLVWPFAGQYMRLKATHANDQSIIDNTSTYGDILWSSGPLHEAHQQILGNNCAACHQAPFEKVQDEVCVSCHTGSKSHYESPLNNLQKNYSHLAGTACQSCHKEHNEPESLVVTKDALCVDCHALAFEKPGSGETINTVSGFTELSHPEFKFSILKPEIDHRGIIKEWTYFHSLPGPNVVSHSNLKFPHDVHMDVQKMRTTQKPEGMACIDCHTLKSDNEHFEAINMEQHCAACHDLNFDPLDLDKTLPHGKPRQVIQMLEDHFVKYFADPQRKTQDSSYRRRPGQEEPEDECENLSAFDCGTAKAFAEARVQFTQRGCVTCHEVTDTGEEDIYSKWRVLPVKLNTDWFRRAHFDHASHLTQRGQDKNRVCLECHNAQESSRSEDILIPQLDNCLTCHGDQSVNNIVRVNCVSCHQFHESF